MPKIYIKFAKVFRFCNFFWSIFSCIFERIRRFAELRSVFSSNTRKYGPEKTLNIATFPVVSNTFCANKIVFMSYRSLTYPLTYQTPKFLIFIFVSPLNFILTISLGNYFFVASRFSILLKKPFRGGSFEAEMRFKLLFITNLMNKVLVYLQDKLQNMCNITKKIILNTSLEGIYIRKTCANIYNCSLQSSQLPTT